MITVPRWTGAEAKLLRAAMRLSMRDFAEHLGVSDRTVTNWEGREAAITPLTELQRGVGHRVGPGGRGGAGSVRPGGGGRQAGAARRG